MARNQAIDRERGLAGARESALTLGDVGPAAVATLTRLLSDSMQLVQEDAVKSLVKIGGKAVPALAAMAKAENAKGR